MDASTSILTSVDGSSIFQLGDTKVICSVSGPIEPKPKQELPTQLALEVIVKPAKGSHTPREKLIEDKIRSILTPVIARHLYPRQLIQITFQILEAGENTEFSCKELSGCINSGFLALIDSGISLLQSFTSIVLCIDPIGQFISNPNAQQLSIASSTHVISMSITEDKVDRLLLMDSNGTFTKDEVFQVLRSSEIECLKLFKQLKQTIQEKVEKDFIWNSLKE